MEFQGGPKLYCLWKGTSHGGDRSSVLDTDPRGVGGGVREGGGGWRSKILLHFEGIFEFPITV